jgi:ribosome recycling factor
LNLPPMTEERREQMKKIVHTLCEDARISLRQHRQKSHDVIKDEKDDDVKKTLSDELQEQVDKYNNMVEESRKSKEEEVMKI